MRFHEASKLIAELPNDQAVLLLGLPGIGKTALARAVGESLGEGAKIEVRDLCSHLAEDLLGLPYRENNVTKYAPPEWLHRLSASDCRGVLVLDDLAAASAAVQVAAFQLVLERRVGDCRLAKGVRVVATANRREDKSGASVLPAALRNRVAILELRPSIDEWARWAIENGVDSSVPAFLRFRPARLAQLPKDADARGAYATPRSWASLGRAIKTVTDPNLLLELASGLVGQGPATEFLAFARLKNELPDPAAVLADPERTIPEPPREPDRLVALACAVAEHAVQMRCREAPRLLLRALAHLSKGGREYAALGISAWEAAGGTVPALVAAARESHADRGVRDLLRHLDGVFSHAS